MKIYYFIYHLSAVVSTLGYPFPLSPIPQFHPSVSQRSLHNEPIFRLLLKVAVKGTQQCEFLNFCGTSRPNSSLLLKVPRLQYLFPIFVRCSIKPFFYFRKVYVCSSSLGRRLVVLSSSLRRRFAVASPSLGRRLVVLSSSLCRRFVVGSSSFRRPFVVGSSSRRFVPIPDQVGQ